MTFDADVALPGRAPARLPSIRELLVDAGFREDFLGDDRPPATHYRLKDSGSGFYAEFLTPLIGSELTRDGKRKATAHVAGVNSQQLRFIELLLDNPWQVSLQAGELGLSEPRTVRIASPVGFLAQKLLIHRKRDAADQAKDVLLYMHETLQVFGARLEELQQEWIGQLQPQLHPKDAKIVVTAANRVFGEVTDTIREAAAMAADRDLDPHDVQQACRYGLSIVLAAKKSARAFRA